MAASKKKVYLVREAFEWEYGDQPPARKHPAVWACASREEAIACRGRLLAKCRHVNPFWDAGRILENVTSMGAGSFRKHVRSLGLALPLHDEWGSWWDKQINLLTEEQLRGLWSALDKYPLYQIEETEADGETEERNKSLSSRKAYVVQRLTWQYNDNWHDLKNDEPIKAFRDPELAELYRLELEEPERETITNPGRFAGGGIENATSLSEEQLLARLAELGIEPPPLETERGLTFRYFGNEEWWDRLWNTWPRRVVHQVWDLFDRVRFYEVVEIDLDP